MSQEQSGPEVEVEVGQEYATDPATAIMSAAGAAPTLEGQVNADHSNDNNNAVINESGDQDPAEGHAQEHEQEQEQDPALSHSLTYPEPELGDPNSTQSLNNPNSELDPNSNSNSDPTTHGQSLNPLYPSYDHLYDPYPRSLDTLAEAADAEALTGTGVGVGTGGYGTGGNDGSGPNNGNGNTGSGDYGYSDLFGLGGMPGMGFGGMGVGAGITQASGMGMGVQGMGQPIGVGAAGGMSAGGGVGLGGGQVQGKRAGQGSVGRAMPYHFNHPDRSVSQPNPNINLNNPPDHSQSQYPHTDYAGSAASGDVMDANNNNNLNVSGQTTNAEGELLDEHGVVIPGGANARIQDDKQRKRIMQACEPCRVRKARVSLVARHKPVGAGASCRNVQSHANILIGLFDNSQCNGMQPCGRCTTRNLDCVFAHERKMRGPNKVKKTAEMKAQQRHARQAAKQRDASGQAQGLGHGQAQDGDSMRSNQMVGSVISAGPSGEMELTLDTAANRYDHLHTAGDPAGNKNGGRIKSQQQQQLEYDARRQELFNAYGTDGLGRDSYDRTGQQPGQYFSLTADPSVSNGFGYPSGGPNTAQSVGSEYYSSFSRSNGQADPSRQDERDRHSGVGADQQERPQQMIDDRLEDPSEEDRARLVALIGAGARLDPAEGNDSPGRRNNQALAAYLLPEGDPENVGEYSPVGTGVEDASGQQW